MIIQTFVRNNIFPLLPQFAVNKLRQWNQETQYKNWEKNGKPVPPPHLVKQKIISGYQKKFGIDVLIETGTFLGDMIEAQKNNFKKIYSIELSDMLYKKAGKRFRDSENVTLVLGDSGKKLPEILSQLNEPAIFWLDGHYSAGDTAKGDTECPIYEELDAILLKTHQKHIILIDDARCFDGTGDYPTIKSIENYIMTRQPDYKIEVEYDVMRFII
jgi:hypothetical protein